MIEWNEMLVRALRDELVKECVIFFYLLIRQVIMTYNSCLIITFERRSIQLLANPLLQKLDATMYFHHRCTYGHANPSSDILQNVKACCDIEHSTSVLCPLRFRRLHPAPLAKAQIARHIDVVGTARSQHQ